MKNFVERYKLLLLSLLLGILVLASLITNHNDTKELKQIAQQMQSRIQSDRIILDNILLDLQETLLISGKKAYEKKSLEYQSNYKDQFAFYLYQNEKLSLWTDNHIPVSNFQKDFNEGELQHIGSYHVLSDKKQFQEFSLIGLQIIEIKYPWENNYLLHHIAPYFKLKTEIDINSDSGQVILDSHKKKLFYIQMKAKKKMEEIPFLLFLLFTLSFFVLALLLKNALSSLQERNIGLSIVSFVAIMWIWFKIHFILGFPEQLIHSQLFSSNIYAHSLIQPSLGHLFYSSIILFLTVIFLLPAIKQIKQRKWFLYLFLILIFMAFYAIILLIKSLIFDSQINLNLFQLSSLNRFSYLALWIIYIVFLSWLILVHQFFKNISQWKSTSIHLWSFILSIELLNFILFLYLHQTVYILMMLVGLFVIAIFYLQKHKNTKHRLSIILFYLLFFTSISAAYINSLSTIKEEKNRQTAVLTANLEKDPLFESYFLTNDDHIINNPIVKELLCDSLNSQVDDSLLHYITDYYFKDYSQLYYINLIHCKQNSLITIMPENIETPCFNYFQEKSTRAQEVVEPNILYLIEGSFQYRHYLAKLNISLDSICNSSIFIEFVSKIKAKEMGLPAILEKAHLSQHRLIRNYSYAIYKNNELLERYGKYDYRQKLIDYKLETNKTQFFDLQGYKHYLYAQNENEVMMVSLEKPKPLEQLASFTFIFLFYSLLTFLLYSLLFPRSLKESINSFQGRLQYSMIILLLFSFVLIGLSSLYYIYYLNQNKNKNILLEKAHSVLIELEHKLSGIEEFTVEDQAYTESLLIKFSEVFFTDITLFNGDGLLIASSRPEMFTAELLSKRMEAEAFYELNFLRNSYFIQDEKIGTQEYLSAYLPFRNRENLSVAYLNLPYFAKQYELEEEVSGFIVAFLNIYLFLLLITLLISIIISRYLSKPLLLIKEKLQHLDLEHTNDKIEWKKDDEIGELVKEYNRMVDELSLSASKLARSQRESAWREMAQQIAHEIKNPLTPMKLNVQYLQKAWDDGVDDYEERMKKITKGLQEQIDVLSNIANQFSSFAALEEIHITKLSLTPIIEDVIAIFKSNEYITFETHFEDKNIQVYADKNQLIRIFNNLYKNAIQAIGQHQKGVITTQVSVGIHHIKIDITDNGCGITAEELAHIFEPRFTTKTSGMGLGLALVKKMLENVDGSISVHSKENMGSTFSVFLPLKPKE